MKAALIIIDGLGNIPGNSPLEKAHVPYLDEIAKKGRQGIFYSIGKGLVPGSDIAHLYIFGYDEKNYIGRGPLEALGLDIKLKHGDLAFRTNFAIVDNNIVIDRRAGRIKTEDAKKLEKKIGTFSIDGYEIQFKASTEHRGVLVIKGKGLSKDISPTDPGKDGMKLLKCMPLNKQAKKTADIVNKAVNIIMGRLQNEKANALLLRGPGMFKEEQNFYDKHGLNAEMIAGGALYKGIARFVGMKAKNIKNATGDIKSNYYEKAREAIKAKEMNDIVFIHVKAADNFGHDGNEEGKIKAYEKIDRELIKHISNEFDAIIITGDHATPWQLKRHSAHGAIITAYGQSIGKDETKAFNEIEASKGSLQSIEKHELINFVKDWINKSKKVGS
ncbi:MAG: 2,3-bisphosphoglycerate-independent phosphoglycerate mutase [Candidatus Anstonellales archaeon]